MRVSKADAKRAMALHLFEPMDSMEEAFDRLRSVRFDPIAPVGANHDLVLQARVPGYQVGDWERITYEDRLVYDGWDKMASLVPFEGWPLRRAFNVFFRNWFERIFNEHPQAIEAVLKELETAGPLSSKEFIYQEHRPDRKGSWYGPSVTKLALRALWHTGQIMTSRRRKGQHVYDLTERIVPPHLYAQPVLDQEDAVRELVLDRHRAAGLLRPNATAEVWSYFLNAKMRNAAIRQLVEDGDLVRVDVAGVKAHATPEFLSLLDGPAPDPRVVFVAPLDQLLWDRKFVGHLYDFEYTWEIYVPEAKRRWGYYVLPVLYGENLVAKAEFWCRNGLLELRRWHTETELRPAFFRSLERALREFMHYARATEIRADPDIDPEIREVVGRISAG